MSSISNNYSNYSSLFGTSGINSNSYRSTFSPYSPRSGSPSSNYGINTSPFSAAQSNSAISFKSSASNLQSTVDKLLTKKNDGSSIFGAYKATSSNTDLITAQYKSDTSKYSSEALEARRNPNYVPKAPEAYGVKTAQLATTQKNTGTELASKGMDFEKNKTYRFEIAEGGKTTSFAFVTENGDTNESTQKKMAQAINDKNIGVKASVSTNSVTGKSSLVLESRNTGIKDGQSKAFQVNDLSGYNASSITGANNTTQNAQNAQYYVGKVDESKSTSTNTVLKEDAELRTSESNNDIKLDERTSVSLKKTSDSFVKVGFSRDGTEGINAARDLVNGFNGLYENALKNGNNVSSARLANTLSTTAQTYEKSLAAIGISRNTDGYLTIDEDKMKKAAESGKLEDFFSSEKRGQSYGFTNKLDSAAKSVGDNPAKYVEKEAVSASSSSGSANVWDSQQSTTSNYSKLYFNMQKYESMGSLFNSMF